MWCIIFQYLGRIASPQLLVCCSSSWLWNQRGHNSGFPRSCHVSIIVHDAPSYICRLAGHLVQLVQGLELLKAIDLDGCVSCGLSFDLLFMLVVVSFLFLFFSHLKHNNYMVQLLFLQVEPLWEVNILLFRFLCFKYCGLKSFVFYFAKLCCILTAQLARCLTWPPSPPPTKVSIQWNFFPSGLHNPWNSHFSGNWAPLSPLEKLIGYNPLS